MKEINVTTQAELEQVCKEGNIAIVRAGSFTACDSSKVRAYGSSQVTAHGSSQVTACSSSQVRACGSSQVTACGSSQVTACDSSQVTAYGSSQVRAYGSSKVTAYGSSQVTAYDSSQVTAYGSSQVRACDSSKVTAYDSSQVTAYGSSQVRAYDSSQVTAYDSSQVTASQFVAVTAHSKAVKVIGGKVIVIKTPRTAAQWCSFYGLTVSKGVVTLFKAVDGDFKSNHNGFDYTPGTIPVAPDWDGGREECGGGLHFSPRPFMALKFSDTATRFVACPVRLRDIRKPREGDSYPEKIKAKGCCAPVWECDIDGNRI